MNAGTISSEHFEGLGPRRVPTLKKILKNKTNPQTKPQTNTHTQTWGFTVLDHIATMLTTKQLSKFCAFIFHVIVRRISLWKCKLPGLDRHIWTEIRKTTSHHASNFESLNTSINNSTEVQNQNKPLPKKSQVVSAQGLSKLLALPSPGSLDTTRKARPNYTCLCPGRPLAGPFWSWMYQHAATCTPRMHIQNELPLPFFQWAHQERPPPPGAKPPGGSNGHNLRQPGPPEGHSSSNAKVRAMIIAMSTTPHPPHPSHSCPPAPPQKSIQVADVQEDSSPPQFLLSLLRVYTGVMEQ